MKEESRMRRIVLMLWYRPRIGVLATGLIGICLFFFLGVLPRGLQWLSTSHAETKDKTVLDKSKAEDLYMYLGAASCSGSACHGSTTPRTKLRIGQNEFYIWSQKDNHAKGYEVLTKEDSQIIAKNLKIPKPEESDRCLVCHAMSLNPDHQGKLYDVTEGVTCEVCHGPAEKWLGPHISKDFDSQKAGSLGMYNTKNLVMRADKCLECHAGSEGKEVTHELIGAGHPRLTFEIDNYTHAMPPHWLPPKNKKELEWFGTRAWAVGQAAAFRNQIKRLVSSRRTGIGLWPDLAHFDCFACHHAVVDRLHNISEKDKADQPWRNRDYDGKPGRLVLNSPSYAVFRHVANLLSPEEGKDLERLMKAFHEGLTGKGAPPESFNITIRRLSELSEKLLAQVSQYTFTQKSVWSLMISISGDNHRLTASDFQAAEQAVLALASLYDAYVEAVGPMPDSKAVKETIDGLYKEIQSARTFSASDFEETMRKMHKLLSKSNSHTTGPS